MQEQLKNAHVQLNTTVQKTFDNALNLMADKTKVAANKVSLNEAIQTYNESKAAVGKIAALLTCGPLPAGPADGGKDGRKHTN